MSKEYKDFSSIEVPELEAERLEILNEKRELGNIISYLESNFKLTPWEVVDSSLRMIESGYGGKVDSKVTTHGDLGRPASLQISGEVVDKMSGSSLEYKAKEGGATVVWETSSNHKVVFKFTLTERRSGTTQKWGLEAISIGSDRSENLYPQIRELAQSLELEVQIVKE